MYSTPLDERTCRRDLKITTPILEISRVEAGKLPLSTGAATEMKMDGVHGSDSTTRSLPMMEDISFSIASAYNMFTASAVLKSFLLALNYVSAPLLCQVSLDGLIFKRHLNGPLCDKSKVQDFSEIYTTADPNGLSWLRCMDISCPNVSLMFLEAIPNLRSLTGNYPALKSLTLIECPRLGANVTNARGNIPATNIDLKVPALEVLEVMSCPGTIYRYPCFERVLTLKLCNVTQLDDVVFDSPFLEHLSLVKVAGMKSVKACGTNLKSVKLVDCGDLTDIEVHAQSMCVTSCNSLVELTENCLVSVATITGCENLEKVKFPPAASPTALTLQDNENLEVVDTDFHVIKVLNVLGNPRLNLLRRLSEASDTQALSLMHAQLTDLSSEGGLTINAPALVKMSVTYCHGVTRVCVTGTTDLDLMIEHCETLSSVELPKCTKSKLTLTHCSLAVNLTKAMSAVSKLVCFNSAACPVLPVTLDHTKSITVEFCNDDLYLPKSAKGLTHLRVNKVIGLHMPEDAPNLRDIDLVRLIVSNDLPDTPNLVKLRLFRLVHLSKVPCAPKEEFIVDGCLDLIELPKVIRARKKVRLFSLTIMSLRNTDELYTDNLVIDKCRLSNAPTEITAAVAKFTECVEVDDFMRRLKTNSLTLEKCRDTSVLDAKTLKLSPDEMLSVKITGTHAVPPEQITALEETPGVTVNTANATYYNERMFDADLAKVKLDKNRTMHDFLTKLASCREFKSEDTRGPLVDRLRDMIRTFGRVNESVRQTMLTTIHHSMNACHDKPVWALNQMHVTVLTEEAFAAPPERRETELRKLGAAVQRLSVVQHYANKALLHLEKKEAANRRGIPLSDVTDEVLNAERAGDGVLIDDVSVHMTFEVYLRESLRLPVVASKIDFPIPVPQSFFDDATYSVQAIDKASQSAWLQTWDAWERHKREACSIEVWELYWEYVDREGPVTDLMGEPVEEGASVVVHGREDSFADFFKFWRETGKTIDGLPLMTKDFKSVVKRSTNNTMYMSSTSGGITKHAVKRRRLPDGHKRAVDAENDEDAERDARREAKAAAMAAASEKARIQAEIEEAVEKAVTAAKAETKERDEEAKRLMARAEIEAKECKANANKRALKAETESRKKQKEADARIKKAEEEAEAKAKKAEEVAEAKAKKAEEEAKEKLARAAMEMEETLQREREKTERENARLAAEAEQRIQDQVALRAAAAQVDIDSIVTRRIREAMLEMRHVIQACVKEGMDARRHYDIDPLEDSDLPLVDLDLCLQEEEEKTEETSTAHRASQLLGRRDGLEGRAQCRGAVYAKPIAINAGEHQDVPLEETSTGQRAGQLPEVRADLEGRAPCGTDVPGTGRKDRTRVNRVLRKRTKGARGEVIRRVVQRASDRNANKKK